MNTVKIIVIAALVFICFETWHVSYKIEQAGGIKQVIIDTGKEIKDIVHKIEED